MDLNDAVDEPAPELVVSVGRKGHQQEKDAQVGTLDPGKCLKHA